MNKAYTFLIKYDTQLSWFMRYNEYIENGKGEKKYGKSYHETRFNCRRDDSI